MNRWADQLERISETTQELMQRALAWSGRFLPDAEVDNAEAESVLHKYLRTVRTDFGQSDVGTEEVDTAIACFLASRRLEEVSAP